MAEWLVEDGDVREGTNIGLGAKLKESGGFLGSLRLARSLYTPVLPRTIGPYSYRRHTRAWLSGLYEGNSMRKGEVQ